MKPICGVKGVANLLGCSERTAYRLMARGLLPGRIYTSPLSVWDADDFVGVSYVKKGFISKPCQNDTVESQRVKNDTDQ